jgi:branched-subunit amino acid ABC-type transport system permease component
MTSRHLCLQYVFDQRVMGWTLPSPLRHRVCQRGSAVQPPSEFSGAEYTIIGFIVVVLGGLGNPMGALAAGFLYGLAEQLAAVFLPQAMAPIVGFGILVGTIMLRPAGLFGRTAAR